MALPSGTAYIVPFVCNKSKVAESFTNFPYSIDLSAKLAGDSIFKSHILSNVNIAIYDVDNDSIRPKIIKLDLTNNKLFIYFDASTSTSINRVFYCCVGASVNQIDSVSALTNSGVECAWLFDEFSGTTAYDECGNYNGTVRSPASLSDGKANFTADTTGGPSNVISTSKYGFIKNNMSIISVLTCNIAGSGTQQSVLNNNASGGADYYIYRPGSITLFSNGVYNTSASNLPSNTKTHVGTTISSTSKLNHYIQGALSGTPNQTVSLPTANPTAIAIGGPPNATWNGFNGSIERIVLFNVEKSATFIATSYEQNINASTFWSIEPGRLVTSGILPASVKAWVKIIINKSQVLESTDHFLYQYDLSSVMLHTFWRKHWSSAANVLVFDPQQNELRPRKVIADGALNKLLIYFDGAKSKVQDYIFYVGTGLAVNESDSASAFTASGRMIYYGLNENSGSITEDYVAGNNGTVVSPLVLGVEGKFYKACNPVGLNGRITTNGLVAFSNKTRFVVTFAVYIDNPTPTSERVLFQQILDSNNKVLASLTSPGNLVFAVANSANTSGYINISTASIGWHFVQLVFDGNQSGNVNRLKIYFDGILQSLTFVGTIPSSTPDLSAAQFSIGYVGYITNIIDEFDISSLFQLDRYNMLFNPSVFASISSVLGNSKSRHSVHTGVSVSI